MIKFVIAAASAAFAIVGVSAAETFTYQSTNGEEANVGGTAPDGSTFGGSYWDGSGTAAYDGGRRVNYTFKCISMSQPPRDSIFMSHSACNVTSEDGNFSIIMGCNLIDAAKREVSCIGGMNGETGAYQGRRGTLTNYSLEGKATGTGQWNDRPEVKK